MIGTKDLVSVAEMITDISQNLYDEEFNKLGRSYYKMLVHRALQAFAIESFYQIVTKDIYNWNEEKTFILDIPSNSFNLREMIFFNSSCKGSTCSCSSGNNGYPTCWGSFRIAHYKRTFNRFGSSGIETANISNRSNRDPVYQMPDYNMSMSLNGVNSYNRNNLIFFGDQEGSYCISDNADEYKNVRLRYNGIGVDSDKAPAVPLVFRDAIIDKCVERACFRLKLKYPEYRVHWMDSMISLDGKNGEPGSWKKAKRLAKRMDTKKKEDYREYFGNMDNK